MFSHTYVHHRTTKINKRAAKNPYLAHANDRPEESLYDDPRIKIRSRAKRRKGGLSFHREGRFVKEAELLRAKTLNEAYADRDARRHFNQASSAQRGTDEVAADAAAAAARPAKGALVADPGLPEPLSSAAAGQSPQLEWWDLAFLPERDHAQDHGRRPSHNCSHNSLAVGNVKRHVHRFVEHPVHLKGPCASRLPASHPLMLTKKERKRLRRQKRKEQQSEQGDLIRLGLMKAPEPRMKLSNLMRILGDRAVADPSQMERKVRQQMAARRAAHLSANAGRKLSKEARREKILQKSAGEVALELHAVLIGIYGCAPLGTVEGSGSSRLPSMYDANTAAQRRFKVDVNAQENLLTGCCLVCENFMAGQATYFVNLVYVEGSRRATRRFTKLMTRRIDWNSETASRPAVRDPGGGTYAHQPHTNAPVTAGGRNAFS